MIYEVFVDTNVYLDAILERTAEWKDAESIMKMADLKRVQVYTSANHIINTMYALRKQKLTQHEIISIVELILSYTELIHTSNLSFSTALQSGFIDLEDAVQYHTALSYGDINFFITSNIKDYKNVSPKLPVLIPAQFVTLYNKIKGDV